MTVLKIGALAERTGTTAPTIRYYESIELLPKPTRQTGGQRTYTEDDAGRLTFIRRCREFGFSIDQVRILVDLSHNPNRSCLEVREIANSHLDAVRHKLKELRGLERVLSRFADSCNESCVGGPGPQCVPLVRLGDRSTGRPA